jgi:hypothetical protein
MALLAVSAASRLREAERKHKAAVDQPRAKHLCRDFLSNLRAATGRKPQRAAECTSRGGIRGMSGNSGTMSTIQKSDGGGRREALAWSVACMRFA